MTRAFVSRTAAALCLIAAPLAASAQTPQPRSDLTVAADIKPMISAQQMTRLKAVSSRYDQRIATAFKGKETLRQTMETDLRAIEAEAAPARRKALIQTYRSKHGAAYKQVLREGGVDLKVVSGEFSAIVPELDFEVVDGLNLRAVPRTDATRKKAAAKTSAPRPTTQVKALMGADYSIDKDLSCGAIAGSSVTTSGGYMRNSTWAAEAGGCENEGTFRHRFTTTANQTVRVEMTADLETEAYAVAILAEAIGRAHASLDVTSASGRSLSEIDGYDYEVPSVNCYAFAMFMWATSETCERQNVVLSVELKSPGTYVVRGHTVTRTIAGGVVTGTTAEARIKQLRTTITTEPK
ncbi:hypothetical protein PQU92_15000 [Asticcacaulis sp. BYS171W]|uniref:Uncharacterized protein n=1 Tax=Asticcacaulis aquaticus TaxID=2984212 RepID=A0ABT5HYS2_9CAUL|nr:hypothetical protein [Asticcacaulis aquaticus]MDC7684591.1 hypothetical protein [Asticcacaulis aquaticus]